MRHLVAKKKQVALGLKIRNIAGHNPSFGRSIDKLPHGSAARNRMAAKKRSAKR